MGGGARYGLFFCDTQGGNSLKGAQHETRHMVQSTERGPALALACHHCTCLASSSSILRRVESCVAVDAATQPDLRYLVEPTCSHFDFFEHALLFLERSCDADLAHFVQDYLFFMEATHGVAAAAVPPSLGVEVLWRAHLLNPQAYAEDFAALLGQLDAIEHSSSPLRLPAGTPRSAPPPQPPPPPPPSRMHSWLGLDLVAAVRRQQPFMRSMLAQRGALATRIVAEEAVQGYACFLSTLRCVTAHNSVNTRGRTEFCSVADVPRTPVSQTS